MKQLLKHFAIYTIIAATTHTATMYALNDGLCEKLADSEETCAIKRLLPMFDIILGLYKHKNWGEDKRVEALKKILTKVKPEINRQFSGFSALHGAIVKGYPKIVSLLLENGADINQCSNDLNFTTPPLLYAILKGQIKIAKLLISKRADLAGTAPYTGCSALEVAAQNGYIDVVAMLLNNKVDIQTQDKLDNTALHAAATYGNKKILRLLVKNGIKLDVKNKKGFTALGAAECQLQHTNDLKKLRVDIYPKLGIKVYEEKWEKTASFNMVITKKLEESIAYLKLATDFYKLLEVIELEQPFEQFTKIYFTGKNAYQNCMDVEDMLTLDTKKCFTKKFIEWGKQNNKATTSTNANLNNLSTNLK